MKIRFIKDYMGQWKRGDIIDPGDGAAKTYIARGLAEIVAPNEHKAIDDPPGDKAVKRDRAGRK